MFNAKVALFSMTAAGFLLTGCNHTGIDPINPETVAPVRQSPYFVQVYPKRADMPKHAKIIGKVTAQNKTKSGIKVPPQQIIEELKRQAVLLGGNGIVHITPGTSQTTADALVSY